MKVAGRWKVSVSPKPIPFLQARHFTDTGAAGRTVDLLVFHLMITPEESNRAEWLQQYWATTERKASSHYNIDSDSTTQSVRDEDVAWAAPGANHDGVQIEQAGTLQTPAQWDDDYSKGLIEQGADLGAHLSQKHELPAVWRNAQDLREGKRGITDHWEVTKAFGLSTHSDCGQGFRDPNANGKPSAKASLLNQINERLDADHNKDAKPDRVELPDLEFGDIGWLVKKLQKHLIHHGYLIERDGSFGPSTEQAVKRFQKREALNVTGKVNGATWKRLRT